MCDAKVKINVPLQANSSLYSANSIQRQVSYMLSELAGSVMCTRLNPSWAYASVLVWLEKFFRSACTK